MNTIEQEQQQQQQEQKQQQEQEHQSWLGQPKIYSVTAGIPSNQTRIVYQRYFNRFLKHIKINDLQVLLDFSPKVVKQMIADYILYLHEKRNVKRDSIKVQLSAILHFFQNNNDDFHLTVRNFQRDLPPDESTSAYGDDRPYTTNLHSQYHSARITVCQSAYMTPVHWDMSLCIFIRSIIVLVC